MPEFNTKITLAFPITVGGVTITEVEIGRPKTKHLRQMDQKRAGGASDMDQIVEMVRLLTGLTEEQIDELDAVDFTALSETVGDFFPPPETATPPDGAA